MYYYIDESGNTGLNLFDVAQPKLFYGVLGSPANLDVIAEPLLVDLRKELGVKRIHAAELGVGRLIPVAKRIADFSRKHDLRFSLLKVTKSDHSVISFFDQVFDSGMNKAVSWHHYFTPLRYPMLMKVAFLFDDQLKKDAWAARRESNSARSASALVTICNALLSRIDRLPDARSRELVTDALKWAAANPFEIDYGVGNKDTALQISPNLVGFQQVMQVMAVQSNKKGRSIRKITVDRQTEFNKAQAELASWYESLRAVKHNTDLGPGMPKFDYSMMPEVPPTFTAGDESAGLELVDVTLWITKRLEEKRDVPPELRNLFASQTKRGLVDEVSLDAIDRRWRHLLSLPAPDRPLPADLDKHFKDLEDERKATVAALG
ncbi:DUF3800 domain-containing protein [Agrobacterium tumefaciens]|uniref:DUF3800 domain-containing protein n=1 Tax=Agrobacterium tumefaciens TaxID=358 RepID=UPI001573491B|nr:DUF3800 domain-containing protein [Agrobacterium tumefaciens]NTA45352.1 DUF3800 domain-containing protein [Agrobacterium tumefaciens]UXU08316.1 DUF3800 domain-containing protein [Agrobacterium tumefaciens]WIE36012.1 DUF3800 domain-containing protein [Agrobacterium tumefaciens]